MEKLQSDEDFRRKVEEAPTPEEGREILDWAGFDLSEADAKELRHAGEGQPSDEEIENDLRTVRVRTSATYPPRLTDLLV